MIGATEFLEPSSDPDSHFLTATFSDMHSHLSSLKIAISVDLKGPYSGMSSERGSTKTEMMIIIT